MISLKLILRIMWASKRTHLLNIAGLGIGLGVFLLISLFINTELSFDKHIDNHNNKYRLLQQFGEQSEAIFPFSAGDLIESALPEFQSFCMIDSESGNITVANNNFLLEEALVSDQNFISMFDIHIVEGRTNGLLNDPNTCIVSESTARKLFGENSAIGGIINFNSMYDCSVVAVYQDLPITSHLRVNMVISRSSWRSIARYKRYFESWGKQGTNIYVSLKPDSKQEEIENNITHIFHEKSPWSESEFKIKLQSIQDIHLYSSEIKWDSRVVKNNMSTIRAFAIVMVLILLLACFNYVNITTANSEAKNKFAGILVALGSKRIQIFFYNITQTIIVLGNSFLLAFILVWLILPYFEHLVNLKLDFSQFFIPQFVLYISTVFIFIVIASGIYPALLLSSFSSVKTIRQKNTSFSLRSILIIIQFIVTISLLISILGIRQQVTLLTSKELGFNKEQLIEVGHYKGKKSYDYLAGEFAKIPTIEGITSASNMPCEYINNQNALHIVGVENPNPPSGCIVGVQPNYFSLMGTQLLNGDGFIEGEKSNEEQVLINETTVRLLNLSKPIGIRLKLMGQEYSVIGVVEDIQYRTLHEPALPVLYSSNYNTYSKIALKLHPGNHIESIKQIEAIWRAKYPSETIRINFFDSKLESNYETEINQLYMFNILVFVGGFITVLGLMGLVSFIIEQKTKEIGIRKVNGAKTKEILTMLNGDFIKWVAIAFLAACPIAYYAMNKWLENFAYKTELSWWIFALAGLIAMAIALLTVSIQSWRAASRNPVESLRYE